jgi:hypothetical protein
MERRKARMETARHEPPPDTACRDPRNPKAKDTTCRDPRTPSQTPPAATPEPQARHRLPRAERCWRSTRGGSCDCSYVFPPPNPFWRHASNTVTATAFDRFKLR